MRKSRTETKNVIFSLFDAGLCDSTSCSGLFEKVRMNVVKKNLKLFEAAFNHAFLPLKENDCSYYLRKMAALA